MSVGFRVFGIPVQQGSKKPGQNRKTGKLFVREETGERLKTWRATVTEAALQAREAGDIPTITGAVRLDVSFLMPRPASISPKKRPYPCVAPDLDKLIRAVGDALKDAGVYRDDCLIISIHASKQYATDDLQNSPGAWIIVSEIKEPVGVKS